jgi:hypothetical protein
MAGRERTTLGIGLIVAVLAMTAREYVWLHLFLAIFAVFLIVWGREPRRTESFIGGLPVGGYLLKGLRQLDLVLSPHDLKLEQHVHAIVSKYSSLVRADLRRLLNTHNPASILDQSWRQFKGDGLVDHPHSGPGPIKEEMREAVARALDDLGS